MVLYNAFIFACKQYSYLYKQDSYLYLNKQWFLYLQAFTRQNLNVCSACKWMRVRDCVHTRISVGISIRVHLFVDAYTNVLMDIHYILPSTGVLKDTALSICAMCVRVCLCESVCACVYIYRCINKYVYIYMCTQTRHTCVSNAPFPCVCVYVCAYVRVCIHTHIEKQTCIYIHILTDIFTNILCEYVIWVCVCVCAGGRERESVCVCSYTHVCRCIYIQIYAFVNIYIYKYTNTYQMHHTLSQTLMLPSPVKSLWQD